MDTLERTAPIVTAAPAPGACDPVTLEIVRRPRHPYTRALVAAVPVPDADQPRAPLPIKGNVPDARDLPSGCHFRDRCPHAMPRCAEETPALRPVAGGHKVACHLEDG